jgi:hypothetical protein
MKYSSGPRVTTMPKDGPDSVEVRSRVGDATVQPRAIVGQSEVYAASPRRCNCSPAPGFPKQLLIDTLI